MDQQKPGSLMDGIEFEKRRPVDADWSKLKRGIVGGIAGVLALAAVGVGGYYGWQLRPVTLPDSAEEAIAVINSGRVDRLSPERQQQYYAEAATLLRDIPREQWRETFDEDDREAIGRVFRERFQETLREIARGNSSPQEMFANFRRPRPPQNEQNQDRESGGDRQANAERRDRGPGSPQFQSMLQNSFQNGDAQNNGLMGEFWMMMRAQRQAGGGTGGRPNRGG